MGRDNVMSRVGRADREAGFSLIEMLVACGLFVAVMAIGINATRSVGKSLANASAVIGDSQYLDALEARLHADAESSLGMRVVDGAGLEFAVTDNERKWRRWRYKLGGDGFGVTQDGATTILDKDVTRFTATFVPANELNRSGVASEFMRGLPTPDAYTMDLNGQQITNGVMRIDVRRGVAERTIVLATRVTPSGFGIYAGPEWRGIVYREGHTKHPFLGAQKSRYSIMGVVEYSTDHWKTAHTWCKYEIENVGIDSTESHYDYQEDDHRKIHDSTQVFSACQRQMRSREISVPPTPKPCRNNLASEFCYRGP